jgi:hypothetical protein
MNRNRSYRPSLEAFEDRCCPSVTAQVSGGALLVQGGSAGLQINQVAERSFEVIDEGVNLGTFARVRRLQVDLGAEDDLVGLDLGGFATLNGASINLGDGSNELLAQNGTLRQLQVDGGGGADFVDLSSSLTVNGRLAVRLFAGDDVFGTAAQVNGRARFRLGAGNDSFGFFGQLDSDSDGVSELLVRAGAGADIVTFGSLAVVNGSGLVRLGGGDDTFVLEDRGEPLPLEVHGLGGNDTFEGDPADLTTPPLGFETFSNDNGGGEEGGGEIIPE